MTITNNAKAIASQSHIGCLVLHKVCGTYAKGMQDEFERHLRDNGPEWTIARYKAIYTAAIHLKNGDREKARCLYQQNSISYHKGDLSPKGCWGYAVRQFVNSKKPSVLRRYASVLRIYTSITLGAPSKGQITKFTDAVCSPPLEDQKHYRQVGKELARTVCEDRGYARRVNVERYISHANMNALHGTSYYFSNVKAEVEANLSPSERKQFKNLLTQPYGKFILSLLTETWAPPAIAGLLPYDGKRASALRTHHVDSGFNGRIVMLQQQGGKGRTVFQPTATLQTYFLPLHKLCNDLAHSLFFYEADWENQVDGVYQAIQNLQEGKAVYSVDQSSATDRFPRGISEGILDYFGASKYADALEQVCNRPWLCDFLESPVRVEAGQPMGLYGSFPLYNFSNLMVAGKAQHDVESANEQITKFPDGSCFKIVGDDIILSDKAVADRYTELLIGYGVRISEMKSFSGQVAEFAGFLMLPSKDGVTAFRPYKFPIGDDITNPVEFLHALGIQAASLSPKWALHFNAYQETLKQRMLDLSPMVLGISDEIPVVSHALNKESSVVSLAQSVSTALCQAYDNGCHSKQLASYVNSIYYTTARQNVFGVHNSPEVQRVSYVTGATPMPDTPQYDVFSRSDYLREDNSERQKGHHIAHKRLKDDPLIAPKEANRSEIDWQRAEALFKRVTGRTCFGKAGLASPEVPSKSKADTELRESVDQESCKEGPDDLT